MVGLEVAGIDIITPDIAQSMLRTAAPSSRSTPRRTCACTPTPREGTPRDVGMAIVDHLFPPGQPVRVPIVAITGTNGKTTTTRMIAHIMTTAGKTVGMTTTDGIIVNGLQLVDRGSGGGPSGPQGAAPPGHRLRRAGDGPMAASYETGSASTAATWPWSPTSPPTTSAGWHHTTLDGSGPGQGGGAARRRARRGQRPQRRRPLTVAMAEVAGGEILFFSMGEDSPVVHDHLQQGGRAVVLRQTPAGEMLTLLADEEETAILPAAEIPATMEGRIRVNIANALAATAAAIAQEVPLETIRAALRTFANSVAQTPGRFNLLEIDGRTVVLDYCHNLHGLEAHGRFRQTDGGPAHRRRHRHARRSHR